jgi:hypothetical protein
LIELQRAPSFEIELNTVRSNTFSRYSNALFYLLLPALLLAQWVGLTHRIAHAGIDNHQQNSSIVVGVKSHSFLANLPLNEYPTHHSCIALDATTCTAFLHTPTASLAVHASAQSTSFPNPFKLLLPQTQRFYPSRAPPR